MWGDCNWIQFALSSGQALIVVGVLDMMLAISGASDTFALHFYKMGLAKERLSQTTEFTHHLDYPDWAILGLESCKLAWSLILWMGGLIMGKQQFFKGWIYISLIQEVVIQLLIWVSEYHHHIRSISSSSTMGEEDDSPTVLVLRITYSALIRILIRSFLIAVVFLCLKGWPPSGAGGGSGVQVVTVLRDSAAVDTSTTINKKEENPDVGPLSILSSLPGPSSMPLQLQLPHIIRVPQDAELFPVGSGIVNILRFYYGDITRLTKLLITVDITWGIIRILDKEGRQILFGHGIMMGGFPLSSVSTPIFTEERIIRLFRLAFDGIFLHNLHHDKPPLEGPLVIPKVIEILVSLGILVFIRVVDYASPMFNLFYIFFILDLVFRVFTFALCYKAYGDFLCRRHRNAVTAVANRNLKKINNAVPSLPKM